MTDSDGLNWRYHEPYAFVDSGVPSECVNYPTVIILHGYMWHAPTFRKLLPLASGSKARVILLNRRDYPYSKPYSADDLDLLTRPEGQSGNEAIEGLKEFMKTRASELLEFLSWLTDEQMVIPKIKATSDGDSEAGIGGVTVVGWSAGNRIMLSLLANLAVFEHKMMEKLKSYIRSVILYDCPGNAVLGYPRHPEYYIPLADSSLAIRERIEAFLLWVSGYYDHGDLSILDSKDLEFRKSHLNELKLQFQNFPATPLPSIQTMSEAEVAGNVARQAVDSLEKAENLLVVRANALGFWGMQRKQAFFEKDDLGTSEGSVEDRPKQNNKSRSKKDVWPDLRTHFIWCDASIGEVIYGAVALQNELEEMRAKGGWVRDIRLVRLAGANHYVHWDDPKRALDVFLDCVMN